MRTTQLLSLDVKNHRVLSQQICCDLVFHVEHILSDKGYNSSLDEKIAPISAPFEVGNEKTEFLPISQLTMRFFSQI